MHTRRRKLVVCKQSYIKTQREGGLVEAEENRGSGRWRGGQRGTGDDVLWEIHCRRTVASTTIPFQCCMSPWVCPPAHVISRCLAFWFLVYSQSTLLLSMFLCVCEGCGGIHCYFQGWPVIGFVVWFVQVDGNWQGKPKYWEKSHINSALYTTYPIWPELG